MPIQSIDTKFSTDPVVTPAPTDRFMVTQSGVTRVETAAQILQDYLTEAGINALLLAGAGTLLHVTPENIESLPGFSHSRTGGGTASATYTDANGVTQTTTGLRNNHYISGVRRTLAEGGSENLFLNSFTPATQSVTIPNSVHTCSMKGSGSIEANGATDGSYGTATEGSPLTFTPSTSQSVTFTVSGTVSHEQVEAKKFPTSFISTAGSAVTRNADSLSVDAPFPPQEMTAHVKGVELGTAVEFEARILQIASGSTDDPRYKLSANVGDAYALLHDNGTTGFESVQTVAPAISDTVELRGMLHADGAVQLGQSLNGGTETLEPVTNAIPLQGAWSGTTLWINGINGAFSGFFAFESIRFATGIRSMSDMRAATAIASIAADIVGQSTLASLDGSDSLQKIVAGDVDATQWTEASSGILISNQANVGLTAHTGSSQGNGVITSSFNVYTVVGSAGDAATLPAIFLVNTMIWIKNDDAAESMDIFPASGDDAGAGANVAVALAAGVGTLFIATAANSTWTQMF